jgi:ribosomal protein S6E (S10)
LTDERQSALREALIVAFAPARQGKRDMKEIRGREATQNRDACGHQTG